MPVEERACNGSTESRSLSAERAEELITYKRRRHCRPCMGNGVHPHGTMSVTQSRLPSNQTTYEPLDAVLINSANKEDGHAGRDHVSVNDYMRGHWEMVLGQMLESPDVSEGGIQNCIQYALASSTSGFIISAVPKQTAHGKEPICCQGDSHVQQNQLQSESRRNSSSCNAINEYQMITSDRSNKEPKDETNARSVTEICQSVFLDVIVSDKFSSLCNLLCRNFQGIKANGCFDFSCINSRMEKGQYEDSSELFALDIQKVWKNFEMMGEEMIHLAKSLSNISRDAYYKQVGDLGNRAIGEWKDEEINQVGAEQKDSVDLNTAKQFPPNALDPSTKAEQSESCGLNKIYSCKHCGAEADGKRRLVCDGCEAMYHISCIDPPVEGIPNKSWYCAACSVNGKESPEPDSTQSHGEILHHNCVICEKLKGARTRACDDESHTHTINISDDSEEASDSSVEDDRLRESQRILGSRLCKLCKTGEEEGMRFVICQHKQCAYRACFINKDDDKIVLCDGCDEGYHIYCMVPPRTTIPKGNWYCMFCMIEIRARRRMKLGCEAFIDKHKKKITSKMNGRPGGSVDMLLSAAEKLNSEDKRASRRKNC
ncbi:hypothetical protein MRB53_000362 [Persea americana]|uniref:Uncharacterized protein n=1 Tax=Persea americana TaxID=3435 RepID=A0ACC2MPP3_PERAE|nr:hypothetical protein MRB53_000362 [Persea americana]